MAKIPVILEAGRADGKLIKTNSIYDDNQEKFLSDKIKEIDDNHNNLNNTVNDLTDTVNNNELDIENKLEAEQNRATNTENNLRETINNITEISGSATTANIVTVDTIPNTSSSNVQQALNELFKNATFAGIATPTTNPGTPDSPVFYIASKPGVYSNFGGVELTDQVFIFTAKNGNWVKQDFGIVTSAKVYELEFKSKVVINKEHLIYDSPYCETGELSNDGSIINTSLTEKYTTFFYPTDNLISFIGKRLCFYDSNKNFISLLDNETSSIYKEIEEIPDNAVYVRIFSYTPNNIFLGYADDIFFQNKIKLYNIVLDRNNGWWNIHYLSSNKRSSGLHYGKCKLYCNENYSFKVLFSDSLNGLPHIINNVSEYKIKDNVYWRVTVSKVDGSDFNDKDIEFISCDVLDDTEKITELSNQVNNIYSENKILEATIEGGTQYNDVSRPCKLNAGTHTLKIEKSEQSASLSIYFCKDNINSTNRIISISNISSNIIDVTITKEQAEIINVIGIISNSPSYPLDVKIYIVNGIFKDYEKNYNYKRNTRKLIGATFFDGWSYQCWLENYRNSNRIYQLSDLYKNSGSLNTPELAARYESEFGKKMQLNESQVTGLDRNGGIDGSGNKLTSWVDYVYATTGKYPPGSVTFCNFFPDIAYGLKGKEYICGDGSTTTFLPPHNHNYMPISKYTMKDGQTTNGLTEVELGWRNTDTLDQMEAQIDMASYYGIDYFNFCLILTKDMISDGKVDEELFYNGVKNMSTSVRGWQERGNKALINFMKAKNSYKMKFCLMILTSYENYSDSDYNIIMDFIYEKFITDKRYLYFNGRPVLLWYNRTYGGNYNRIYHFNKDVILHFVGGNIEKFDGKFLYAANGATKAEKGTEDENGYIYYKYKPVIDSNLNSTEPNIQMLIPFSLGWHSSQRSNFVNNAYCDLYGTPGIVSDYSETIMPTKEEIIEGLKKMLDKYNTGENDCIILLYAWNESGEGGYLLPSQAEIENVEKGFYKLEAIKEFKSIYL